MDKPFATLAFILTSSACWLPAQPAADGEIRLPLSELRRLLDEQKSAPVENPPPAPAPPPALLSARMEISQENSQPRIDARFRVMAFGNDRSLTPLFGGDLSLLASEPEAHVLIREDNHTCLVTESKGMQEVDLQLIPTTRDAHALQVPECASRILECGKLPENHVVEIINGPEKILLKPGDRYAVPMADSGILWKIIRSENQETVAQPPKPSTWSWRHEVLVLPRDNFLEHRSSSRASARDGAGLQAKIALPRGAYDVQAEGPDLVESETTGDENGAAVLQLTWKTQGILERRVEVRYRLSASPLDPEWTLQAPAGDDIRYLLASHPQLNYEADPLKPPVTPIGLPTPWMDALSGNPIHTFPADGPATIRISAKPIAETATGMIPDAKWDIRIEPDGSMLATGGFLISHKSPYDFSWEVPAGMELLSCELNHVPNAPTRLDANRMSLHLPGASDKSEVLLAFTGRTAALHPLEGTLDLTLPVTPSFITKLDWFIRLPESYQAETSGNLTRMPAQSGTSTIHLRKNLCRNEQPQARLFYLHTQATR